MRILIDTDPGVDDAMALLLACASPELEIAGVTTVFGNNPDVSLLTRNALAILALAGRPEIPVAMGARRPLASNRPPIGIFVHGDNGLGGAALADATTGPIRRSAAEFIISTCAADPENVTLVTLAPLTNIALALALCPELPAFAPRLSMMGGAVSVPGNSSPCSESNIFNDPEAAQQVFQSGMTITLSALDVTGRAAVGSDYLDDLRALGACGRAIHAMSQHYLGVYLRRGQPGLIMHDVHAIMVLLRPDLYTTRQVAVDVETSGTLTRGQTVADWGNHWNRPVQTTLLVDVDAEGFKREFMQRIARLP